MLFHRSVSVSDISLLRAAMLCQRTSWNLGLNECHEFYLVIG
jgi:hypothetical protein